MIWKGTPDPVQLRQSWTISQEKEIRSWCWGQLVDCSPSILLKRTHNVHMLNTILHSIFAPVLFYKVSPPVTKASQPEKNPLEPGCSPTPSGHPNAPAEHLPFPVVIVSTCVFLSFSLEYFDGSHIPVPTLANILLGIQAKWVLPKWENSA